MQTRCSTFQFWSAGGNARRDVRHVPPAAALLVHGPNSVRATNGVYSTHRTGQSAVPATSGAVGRKSHGDGNAAPYRLGQRSDYGVPGSS